MPKKISLILILVLVLIAGFGLTGCGKKMNKPVIHNNKYFRYYSKHKKIARELYESCNQNMPGWQNKENKNSKAWVNCENAAWALGL